ncbi:MAG: CocE/NonD family hydrolase [Candidatus Poseidoniaceae archaeon]|nr:CocE/NonD family hydrolase [Candidatus Poseidoniaceae archaeon]
MEEVLVAELAKSSDEIAASERRDLNLAVGGIVGVIIVFSILALVNLAPSATEQFSAELDLDDWRNVPLQDRHLLNLSLDTWRSKLPEAGPYEILPMSEHYVPVSLPVSEQDAGYPEPPVMHLALWLPDVEEGVKVPVIATVHPYYDFGTEIDDSNPNTVPDLGVGQWIFEEFIAHGYALAQVSTFGSGKSTHCQDVKGLGEQVGIQAAVEWLGTQNWSNGNVGLMGKSYAGTTNWEAAQNPSEHLKTIVPISGSIGVQQMFYRNGSSEARAVGYDLAYQGATSDLTTDDMRICSDDIIGPAMPITTSLAAEFGGADWSDYWEERYHLGDVLDNYNGSVYIVWGMQDWNVDPYHAFPAYQMLRDKGLTVRGIMGQWGHNYPDQGEVHAGLGSGKGKEAYANMSRMDWAIELFNWFEYWLKGVGDETESYVQMQTHDGRWHLEETWPPEDMTWELDNLNDWSGQQGTVNANGALSFVSPPFEDEIHLSGLPTLHLEVQTLGCNGGQIFATLWDETIGLRLGHAVMDLRYRDGGYDAKPTSPIGSYTMLMEFNPLDVVLPAGHSLSIELTDAGEDYLPSICAATGLGVIGGTFGMPLIERPVVHENWFEVAAYNASTGE